MVTCSFVFQLLLILLCLQEVGHMDSGDREEVDSANLQTMACATSDTASMECVTSGTASMECVTAASDTASMECTQDTQVMQSLPPEVGECDENTENKPDSKLKETEPEKENEEENVEKEENESKRRKQDEAEVEDEEEERKKEEDEEERKKLEEDDDLSEEEKFEELIFPTTLEGFKYEFNSDGQLRDLETNEPFQFVIKPDNHYYNQKRYEALGEILNNYVYDLLETECNLKRISIPLDTDKDAVEGEPKSFVFASENALTTMGKLMILIHGSGVVRAGQWARRLIINDCLDSGTQIPYIKRAKEEGYEVLVLNTNENEGKDEKEIRGSETPVKHALYVFQHLLKKPESHGRHKIAIVAHSYGGCVVLSLIEKQLLEKSVFVIAFTDSVHQLHYQLNNPMQQSWLIQRSRNWVSSDKELDEHLPTLSYKKDVPRYSAGTKKHEETSWSAMESIFKYIKSKESTNLQKKGQAAAQKGPAAAQKGTTAAQKGPEEAQKGPAAAQKGPAAAQKGPAAAQKGTAAAQKDETYRSINTEEQKCEEQKPKQEESEEIK